MAQEDVVSSGEGTESSSLRELKSELVDLRGIADQFKEQLANVSYLLLSTNEGQQHLASCEECPALTYQCAHRTEGEDSQREGDPTDPHSAPETSTPHANNVAKRPKIGFNNDIDSYEGYNVADNAAGPSSGNMAQVGAITPDDFLTTYGRALRNGKVECKLCGKVLKSISTFKAHSRLHTRSASTSRRKSRRTRSPEADSEDDEPVFVCDFCGTTFTVKAAMLKHRNLHAQTAEFVCQICDKAFPQHEQLQFHYEAHRRQMGLSEEDFNF